jgi:hypothetical protein
MSFAKYATQELTEVVARLAAAAAKDVDTAKAQVASTLQPTIDALRAEGAQHAQAAQQFREECEQLRAEHAHAAQELRAECDRLREETEELRAEATQLSGESNTLRAERDRLRGEHESIRAEHAQMMAAQGEVTDARVAADQALHQTRNLLDAARADAVRLSDELEQRAADHGVLSEQLEAALAAHRSTLVERLQDVFERVVRSMAVEEVLAAVAEGLAEDFSRVAVFTVSDNRLEPTHQFGFDAKSGIEKAIIPLKTDSPFTQAARGDVVQAVAPEALKKFGIPSFGGSPHRIVTAPIKVRGEVLAVIYADDSGLEAIDEAADDRVKLANLLRHCAVLRLERLTIELKTISEMRAYAKMLLDEVEYVYAADASAGKPEAERQTRLQENVRCARQMYQQRVAGEGPAITAVLDEHIGETAAAKASTAYGRDLAIVAARAEPSNRSSRRATAQAS